jgi:hypothetical protein
MAWEYECAECEQNNTAAPGEPLAMQECAGCGRMFCARCRADHVVTCGSSVPDGSGSSVDFDEGIGG